MVDDIAVQNFVNAIKETPTDTNTNYSATVSRIDNEGVVWVNLSGSDKETPTASTSTEVSRGDIVNVNWRNNQLYVVGNNSDPSAGGSSVKGAVNVALGAQASANVAFEAANRAIVDADRAAVAADEAETHAQEAQASAEDAQKSANNANEYASRALGGLSTVQSVVETLTWITEHGTMTLTSDTAIDPTHVYFVVDANGDYEVGGTRYSVVTEPNVDDLSTYYELSIDESLNNYVGTHLAVTGEGLWLIPETLNGNRVLIATGSGTTFTTAGTYIIGTGGEILAEFTTNGTKIYADGASILDIGKTASNHARIAFDNERLSNNDPCVSIQGRCVNGRYYTFNNISIGARYPKEQGTAMTNNSRADISCNAQDGGAYMYLTADDGKDSKVASITVRETDGIGNEIDMHATHVDVWLDTDDTGGISTDATSGEDKNLFNAIRTLGWWADVMTSTGSWVVRLKKWMTKVTTAIHNLQYLSNTGRTEGAYPSNGSYSSNLPEGWFSTGTVLTLAPHTAYLVIGQSSDNNGGLITVYSQAVVTSGTEKHIWIGANQPYGNSGNKHLFFSYVETGDASIGVGVKAYIYSQSDRGYLWYMLAIPIGYC